VASPTIVTVAELKPSFVDSRNDDGEGVGTAVGKGIGIVVGTRMGNDVGTEIGRTVGEGIGTAVK